MTGRALSTMTCQGLVMAGKEKANIIASIDCDKPDKKSSLAELLQDTCPRQRCIDRVAEQLVAIIEARRRKITWDAIAASMQMNRGTLINAVKTLTNHSSASKATKSTATVKQQAGLPQPAIEIKQYSLPQKDVAATDADQAATPGITVLGRTRIENFNF